MKKNLLRPKYLFPMAYHLIRWHADYYLRKKSFPLVCGVFLTNCCNLQCGMCSIWADKKKNTLTFEQVKDLVDGVVPGLCYLSFSGGEPLLVNRVMDMVSYASAKVPYTHLVTNGLLVNDEVARDLMKAGLSEVSISLDGGREWHNRLRNSPKSFDAVIHAVECFKRSAPTVDIVVNSVLFPDKPEEVAKAVSITESLGVKHKVQAVNRHFRFDGSEKKPEPIDFSTTDKTKIQSLISDLTRNKRVVSSRYYLKKISDYFGGGVDCPMIEPKCLMPHFYLEVSSYGKVSPCLFSTGWQGVADVDKGLKETLASTDYEKEKIQLESCRLCNETMYVCYWEPMLSFPLSNLIKFSLI